MGVKACILQIVPLEGHMKQWTAAGLAAHVREQGRHMTDSYAPTLSAGTHPGDETEAATGLSG